MMPRLGLHPNNNRDAGGGGDGRPRPFAALHESVSGHQTFRSDAELRTLFEVERTFSWGARVPTATLTAKICCDAQQTLPPNVITSARPGSDRRGKPHEAARVHHTSRRRGGGVPARGAGAAGRAHAADRCADELCGGRSRYQTTSHLASRAISQKFIACLSNTLVVAPRKTPQLSPASNNGLALIGEKIRRGISRHGANTSRDASTSAAQSAPWTVLPSCRARTLMLEVRPGDRRSPFDRRASIVMRSIDGGHRSPCLILLLIVHKAIRHGHHVVLRR